MKSIEKFTHNDLQKAIIQIIKGNIISKKKKKNNNIITKNNNFLSTGLELTYGIKDKIIAIYGKNGDKYNSQIYYNIAEVFAEHINTNTEYACYTEDGTIEIPTQIFESKKDIIQYFNKLNKTLKEFGIISSSLVSLQDEGGGHININYPKHIKNIEYEEIGEYKDNYVNFYKKLENYIINNPSIAWCFLSPYDNDSAKINNDVIKYREGEGSYIELRFFMMPRNVKELELHIDFSQALINNLGKIKVEKSNNKSLNSYTFAESLENITKVCEEINFDFNRLVEVGKIDLLKQRHKFGKKFLN